MLFQNAILESDKGEMVTLLSAYRVPPTLRGQNTWYYDRVKILITIILLYRLERLQEIRVRQLYEDE